MECAQKALEWLCNPAAEVSAHYLISEQGETWQMVEENQRAWHAGAGKWGGITDVNSRSIGIELANTGAHPFPFPQMRALEALLAKILKRWHLPAQNVIAHSDLAPTRKIDPGYRFDWRALAKAGLSIWPKPQTNAPPESFWPNAQRFGYSQTPATQPQNLSAFRQRFRPQARTLPCTTPDSIDCALMADLATRWPALRD